MHKLPLSMKSKFYLPIIVCLSLISEIVYFTLKDFAMIFSATVLSNTWLNIQN